jgi:predicted dehydrogenase
MKLGVIGAGNIIPFHLKAALQVGFELEGITARDNSANAKRVAKDFHFKNFYPTLSGFIDSADSFDAVLIASPASTLFVVLKSLAKLNIPILIEKPIFLDKGQLGDLESIPNQSKILVGYNRRYYKTIQRLKEIIQQNPSARVHFKIPELSGLENINNDMIRNIVLENTVHMLDLIQFCIGPEALDVCNLQTLVKTPDTALFDISGDGSKTCEIMFGYAENYSIEVLVNGKRLVVKPLEAITTYTSMEILSPDEIIPFKRYIPKPSPHRTDTFHESADQKPGFLGQYVELWNMTHGGRDEIGARFNDSITVSKFALAFLDFFQLET